MDPLFLATHKKGKAFYTQLLDNLEVMMVGMGELSLSGLKKYVFSLPKENF